MQAGVAVAACSTTNSSTRPAAAMDTAATAAVAATAAATATAAAAVAATAAATAATAATAVAAIAAIAASPAAAAKANYPFHVVGTLNHTRFGGQRPQFAGVQM